MLARFFEWIGNLLFETTFRSIKKDTAQKARLALETWERHTDGRPPKGPESMEDCAKCVIAEYEAHPVVGMKSSYELALSIMEQIDR